MFNYSWKVTSSRFRVAWGYTALAKLSYEYVDVHSHAHEYDDASLREIISSEDIVIVAVGDDFESSRRVVKLSRMYNKIVACVGLHPWSIKNLKDSLREAEKIVHLALDYNVRCLGEVGLDTKFVAETINVQREVFKLFLEAARDHGLILNLHTAGTWEEVYRLLIRYDIPYANFHWYTGPLHLLDELVKAGYSISINPAVSIQKKHQRVVQSASLEIMLTESDSPYKYKGIMMHPRLVIDVVREIGRIKSMSFDEVKEAIKRNFEHLWLKRL